jgi:4-hydroxybenzoate polyprenyltransferase
VPLQTETARLKLPSHRQLLLREVELLCDGDIWMYARTVIPSETLLGKYQQLKRLGSRPLGNLLFRDPFMLKKILNRLYVYGRLMRVHRPIGTFLLLWPTLWALWIASNGHPDPFIVFIFVSGVFIMRSAGCVINDYADRKFDGHVARTKDQPLITGAVSPKEALLLFSALCLIAFGLVLFLNLFTILLAPIGLILASLYPFAKRYTYWPQAVLGAAYAWAIPMAFAAQTNHIPAIAWILYLATVLWTIAYDTMYAMVDREDDKKIGIKTTALLFGQYDCLIIGLFQSIVLGLLALIGHLQHFGVFYYICLLGAAGFAVYQQYLIRMHQRSLSFKAFLNNNWFGLVIWLEMLVQI